MVDFVPLRQINLLDVSNDALGGTNRDFLGRLGLRAEASTVSAVAIPRRLLLLLDNELVRGFLYADGAIDLQLLLGLARLGGDLRQEIRADNHTPMVLLGAFGCHHVAFFVVITYSCVSAVVGTICEAVILTRGEGMSLGLRDPPHMIAGASRVLLDLYMHGLVPAHKLIAFRFYSLV